jgi:integrase
MRVGEVVSLERDDVDAPSLRFRIKAINRKGKHGSRRPRFVPVPGWLMELETLRALIEEADAAVETSAGDAPVMHKTDVQD